MNIKAEKYNRKVTLNCPICGNTLMLVDEETEKVTCSDCGVSFEHDEIINENGENINSHIEDMAKKAKDDLAKQLNETLKKAFKGNKNIRFK
ncbi:TPA: hypothetical protein SMM80_002770 [Proteus mirabilis]|uniref:TFIIB-type zinc ribbon-containing protein n=1 Tax=Proteus mirabilis TaxID=584 RepID=UPI0018C74774|nr:TFIIB-type zinc ribbon-containing protein [Proteus mirabilis]EME2733348.1 hypothetical protein [Proteus mirabilis]MBG5991008.1 hypothetical protein [Proteus mirabilis]MDO1711909.1 TFIIB-type zinc ribbon-containing protein [Proteus mirabilis]HCL6187317.1 hypothetical protein [Proteus mirabilis]HEJ9399159.1 hypothetical protein [Proteus mirabilis]